MHYTYGTLVLQFLLAIDFHPVKIAVYAALNKVKVVNVRLREYFSEDIQHIDNRFLRSLRLVALLAGIVILTQASAFSGQRRNLAGFSTNTLAANDDSSTGAVAIGFPINFFGTS